MEEKLNINELVKECLQCKNPSCVKGCPVNNNIPLFIKLCGQEKYQEALDVISLTSTLPSICSLVCPYENQCMGHCIKNKMNKAVKIPLIEQYITSKCEVQNINITNKNLFKVAIIGSGPAGLACAETLIKNDISVDIYDKYDIPGGILTYGIPDFVLSKEIVNKKIAYLKQLGVNFILNSSLGKDIFIKDLSTSYDAVFLAIGASIGKNMNVENENILNIVDANEFLCDMSRNENSKYIDKKNIIVVGGGNTAIDAARVAKKQLNGKVSIVYRRSENEMPARKDEIIRAKEDGIEFNFLVNPIRFIGEEKVSETECIKMKLVEVLNDRPKPVIIENSNFIIPTDLVIKAISSTIDTSILEDVKTYFWGGISVNDNMQTSIENVFAGGDCVSGPSLVVSAMKDGIKAANNICNFLKKIS